MSRSAGQLKKNWRFCCPVFWPPVLLSLTWLQGCIQGLVSAATLGTNKPIAASGSFSKLPEQNWVLTCQRSLQGIDLINAMDCDGWLWNRLVSKRDPGDGISRSRDTKHLHWPSLQVVRASSHTSEGIPEVWAKMESYRDAMLASGELQGRRRAQQKVWMWSLIQENVLLHFQNHPSVRDTLPHLQDRVTKGSISPGLAADLLLKAFSSSSSSPS